MLSSAGYGPLPSDSVRRSDHAVAYGPLNRGDAVGCIVVGRRRSDQPDSALRFASAEARLRGRPVTLTHVWDLPVEVAIDLEAGDDVGVPVTAHAVPGSVSAALLAQDPELLVLGRRGSSRNHLSRVLRAVLHHVACPVVVVPPDDHARIERIVVGVSETAASAAAARWAAAEAALHHAELVVVHAWQLAPHGWRELSRPMQALAHHQPAAEIRLRQWVYDTLPGLDPVTQAAHGGPLDAILAASTTADLVVVGYSPHERLGRLLHGHIADDLAVLSTCPVAVIPVPMGDDY
jgi:nucleotide-binding universal stress UspA family protein